MIPSMEIGKCLEGPCDSWNRFYSNLVSMWCGTATPKNFLKSYFIGVKIFVYKNAIKIGSRKIPPKKFKNATPITGEHFYKY